MGQAITMTQEQHDEDDDVLIMPPECSGQTWYCLYTRPRHEKSMARACQELDVPHYLPLVRRVREYKSGRKERWLPLFRGYLFCRANEHQAYELNSEKNLLSLLEVRQPQTFLEDLREVRKALTASQELQTVPYVKEGQRVKVTGGPFKGVEGVVEEVQSGYRVFLNVGFIRRSVPLEVDAGQVEPIG